VTADFSPDTGRSTAFVDASEYKEIADWISVHPSWEELLYTHGFILFRGLPIAGPDVFDAALDSLMRPLKEFSEETSPRSSVTERIFTSTDYPKNFPIQFHHEFSYRKSYPDRLAFCCLLPPDSGGATPLADSRKVLRRIPSNVIDRFEDRGIAYVRNFTGLGVSWKDSFGTDDKSRVSEYCREHDIDFSWSGEDLHTSQTAPAIVTHPVTGERAWFNSVVNLNVLGVEPKAVRDAMQQLPGDSLPTNTTYGSGELIEPDAVEAIRQAYTNEAIRFDWQKGDLLVIDNVLTAHARDPFHGDRKVVVGMGSALAA
jgi:alpha-ketoglutarate-dependent taurine dioxygenase